MINQILKLTLDFIKVTYVIFTRKCRLGPKQVWKAYFNIYLKTLVNKTLIKKDVCSFNIFDGDFFCLNPDSFIYSFQEIFILDTYYYETSAKKPVIIDCGSNIGLSALYFRLTHPKAEITAIEADPTTYAILHKNIISHPALRGINSVNKALSDTPKPVSFFINEKIPGSLQMSVFQNRAAGKKIQVKSTTLSKIISDMSQDISMIKMDIEGMETLVIKEASSKKLLKKVGNIIIEYHHNIDTATSNMSQILNIFETNGLRYQLSTNTVFLPFIKNSFQDIMVMAYR